MKITPLPALLLVAGVAAAQSTAPTDPAQPETAQVEARFARWLGCWRLEGDAPGGARVCITPDSPGVRLQTIIAGKGTTDEALRGDGAVRPIVEVGCKGTERTEWSKDNLRLFRYADVTCGTEGSRSVSAILFFGRGPTWLNVEMVGGGDSRMLRVRRYRRVIDRELPDGTRVVRPTVGGAAEWPATTEASWDVDDVIEASSRMPAEVVQAALTEARGRFALNRRSLIALADAGVPEPTIDLMIGLTYPKRFEVRSRGDSSSVSGSIASGSGSYDPFFHWGSSYASCYSPGYGYQSYYFHTGCGPDDYGSRYGYGDDWVPVEPGPPVPTERQPDGRVVNGRGYTQVWPREAEPAASTGNGASGSVESGSGASSGGAPADTSGASSSGYSSGSSAGRSGESGERVAVPRPPDD